MTILPLGPVPVTFERSMFFSEAIFFANGEAIIRSPSLLVVVGEGLGGALMPASSCDDRPLA